MLRVKDQRILKILQKLNMTKNPQNFRSTERGRETTRTQIGEKEEIGGGYAVNTEVKTTDAGMFESNITIWVSTNHQCLLKFLMGFAIFDFLMLFFLVLVGFN